MAGAQCSNCQRLANKGRVQSLHLRCGEADGLLPLLRARRGAVPRAAAEKPMTVPPSGGRKILVFGHEITLKLSCRETDGEYFIFEDVTPPGVGVPLHMHRHEDEFVCVLDGEFEFQLVRQIQ